MYCDIHRLFLQMTKEYPDIITEAEAAIDQFINNPKKRSRTHTPDLGDLILYPYFGVGNFMWPHRTQKKITSRILYLNINTSDEKDT